MPFPNQLEVPRLHVDPSKPLLTQKEQYKDFTNRVRPSPPIFRNAVLSFAVGGIIASVGQVLLMFYQGLGLSMSDAVSVTLATLILLGAIFTAIGLYDETSRWAGAGLLIPISGLANVMVAPAIEARREGLVVGVGADVFSVAGPVLVFGVVISWLAGLLYYLFR